MRRGRILVVSLFLVAGLLVPLSGALAQVTGTIQGHITDQSGAVLPGVTVVVANMDIGAKRTVVTNAEGFYIAKSLRSGNYSVTASLEGMQTVRQENIVLLVGQILDVNLELGVGEVEEIISVTAESPLIEVSRSSAAFYLNEKQIGEYPIIGRDFTAFAGFAPTVLPETDRGFIHISGQKGIYTGMNIDGTSGKSAFFGYGRGGEATENEGLVIAQDSVKEFQVVTAGFTPEYGNNGGGYINVITKSGTNTLKGTAFYFFRDDGLAEDLPSSPLDDARGIDGSRPVDEFERTNWGLSVGGPIQQDRTHFFFSYDQTERDEPFRDDIDIPGLFDAVVGRGGEFLDLVRGYERNVDGTATGLFLESIENLVLFGKVNHQFNDSHSGSFRINYTDYEVTNDIPGGESLKTEDTISIVASLVSLIGSNKVNEARIQLSEDNLDRLSDLEGGPPTTAAELEFRIGGRSELLGKAFFLPIFVEEEKLQIQDNFSYLFGDHDLKFGVDYQKDDLSQLFVGFKDGRFRFTSIDNFLNDFALLQLIFYGPTTNPNFDETQEILAVYAQDTWRANEKLTLNYGFRFSQTDNPGGLQHVFPEGREIPDDTDNFAPRFGFTYALGDAGKDVIRGGAGLFYGRTPTLLFAGPVVQNGLFPNFGISFALFFFDGFKPYGEPIDNLNP
ncbi:MAG: TonB-dependent receptor, partial [Thermoanaerobaculia bacterium]